MWQIFDKKLNKTKICYDNVYLFYIIGTRLHRNVYHCKLLITKFESIDYTASIHNANTVYSAGLANMNYHSKSYFVKWDMNLTRGRAQIKTMVYKLWSVSV